MLLCYVMLCEWLYHWTFPVASNILHVSKWIKQEVVSPFIPVNGHGAVFIHSEVTNTKTCEILKLIESEINKAPTEFWINNVLMFQKKKSFIALVV